MVRLSRILLVTVWVLLLAEIAAADVRLPAIFANDMVLQRDKQVPVWGRGAPNEEVSVEMLGQKVSTRADAQGNWRVDLAPMPAGGPYEMRVSGHNLLIFKNVLVGEVWVCSGQSNMEWSVSSSKNSKEEIAAANYPHIRLLVVRKSVADSPQKDFSPQLNWSECTPQTVSSTSAVAYFFGRELHRRLKVPVGLVETCWGGTPCEAWTRQQVLESDPAFASIVEQRKAMLERRAAIAPSSLYNAMLAPLIPYAIRGTIWYQGESNTSRPQQYRKLFPAMIADWRKQWGQGDFPFYFVQLANFMAVKDIPGESNWAELREAQSLTLKSTRSTGMAVTIDLGEAKDIHPKNKQDVGLRLALHALAKDYGQAVEFSGPEYQSMTVEGNSIRVKFKRGSSGDLTVGSPTSGISAGKLTGFSICGSDRKFVWADARIDGESVVVSSPDVSAPVAVRYAWADNPVCNLYNRAGLPASPFRTDHPLAQTESPTLFAFLVGCSDYDEKEFRSLKFSRNDVISLYDALRSAGYPERNIVLMHDKQPVDLVPEARKIRKQLNLLLGGLRPQDTVIVAFAGHGVQFQGEKQNYFCPRDAEARDRGTLISLEDIYKQLDTCRARRKLLLVDACRNDPVSDLARSRDTVQLDSITRPQTEAIPEGIVALFSCSAGQKAFEHPELKHGIFFHEVIEALSGAAANSTGEVTLNGFLEYVQRETQTYARLKLKALQVPQQKNDFSGSWVLHKRQP